MRIIFCFFLLFVSCAELGDLDKLKPLTRNNKLAFTLYNYNTIICEKNCLLDALLEDVYIHSLTGKQESYRYCPHSHTVFQCYDKGNDRFYVMTPGQWQNDAQFLFDYFHTGQIKKILAQVDFICEQDFALCKNQYDLIKTLEEFAYNGF